MTHRSELHQRLQAVRRRWFYAVLLQICARIPVAAAIIVSGAALADRWIRPDAGALLLLAAATLLAVLAVAALVTWPYRHRPDDMQCARFVEERCPELDDVIVTAVHVSSRESEQLRTQFAPLVVETAITRLRALDFSRLVEPVGLRASAARAGLAAAGLFLAVLFARPFTSRVIDVAQLRFFPGTVAIAVEPGDVRIAAGQPLRIGARVTGRSGTLTRVAPVVVLEANRQSRSVQMEPSGDGHQLRIRTVDRSFIYRVRAGGASSRAFTVTALFPPRVKRIDLRYQYPAFTHFPSREETDGGDVFGPAGTRVRVRVRTDKPVSSGRLAFSEGTPPLALNRIDERTLEANLTLQRDSAYRVSLADADGLTSDGTEYFIRLMDDRPPEVHVLRPIGDQQITPLEEVTIEARADDDYGIESFDLVYAVAGGRERVVPFTSPGGTNVARLGSRLLAAEDLSVKPGDVITYYARARDVARGKPSTLVRSEMFFLEVKPFNEEYSLAQSQAMAASTGTQLESLIAAQKEIISATWNLERRSVAGQSAEDVKAVADAQAELKRRAEAAVGALGPRRGGFEPAQQLTAQPLGSANPVADAVAAMGRAVQHLEARKTGEALPQEMAALTALLKAEAEIRRRQVTQQASGTGSGGSGRQGQDLSNLFDRELKRQQRTNYETRSQVEERPDHGAEASALERIRELARRQEELSRQQRDLANSEFTAEELKRELEKLTREQLELRQQAEALGKQLGAQGAQGAKGSQGAQESAMSKAAEQMRGAATDLRREEAGSAAGRGDQAAQELRNLERQIQGASPDARRRALGELQLEAQQIAEAQRRIASEAEQLDRAGGGSDDGRRRLAGEKDRVADRVDALRQSSRRLASDPRTAASDRTALSDAAGDLDRQHVSDRIRAGARDLRGRHAQPADKTSPSSQMVRGERQLADALDQVARRMNGLEAGDASGEAQRLADDLDRIRGARDRLAELERQITEAKRQEQQPGQSGAAGRGRTGQRAQNGSQGDGQPGDELARRRQEYGRELQQTRELVDRLQRGTPDAGRNLSTPEQHEWSRSAPGTEAWKQDYAKWDSLSKDVKQALEQYETSAAARLARMRAADRLRIGGSDRMPEGYQQRIAKYFESLAKR